MNPISEEPQPQHDSGSPAPPHDVGEHPAPERPKPPSDASAPRSADSINVIQQASTQSGDSGEVREDQNPPGPPAPIRVVVEVPPSGKEKPKVPFKEQVIGVAKKTRGTLLGKPELKQEGEMILEGKASYFTDEPEQA